MENTDRLRNRFNMYMGMEVRKELERQSKRVGLDMSAYLAYLILQEKNRIENTELTEKVFQSILPNGIRDLRELPSIIEAIAKLDVK